MVGVALVGPALSHRHREVQRLRRLLRQRNARDSERCFVIEGPHAVAAAIDAGAPLEAVFVAPGAKQLDTGDVVVHQLAEGVMERVSDAVAPQGVAATCRFVDVPAVRLADASFVIIAAGVSDPGNLGTLLRTAEAAGADGVLCTSGSVDVYNPKTVRSSAGSLFHLPIVVGGDPVDVVREFGEWGLATIVATAHGGRDPGEVDLTARLALLLGNEAGGLAPDVEAAAAERVTIPLQGRAESLNVGMAAAVLAFEVSRQRRSATGRR